MIRRLQWKHANPHRYPYRKTADGGLSRDEATLCLLPWWRETFSKVHRQGSGYNGAGDVTAKRK